MKKILFVMMACVLIFSCLSIFCMAEEVENVEPVAVDSDASEAGWGGALLSLVEEHMAELFSALTLVGSIILAYSYKKGLVPTLWGGLSSIAKTAETTSQRTKELAEVAEVSIAQMTDAASPIFEKIEEMCQGAETLAQQARDLEKRISEGEDDRALVKTIMGGVAEMLYGVFSSANLPQYAKEQIGQKYNAICVALGDASHEQREESHL